MKLIVAGDRNFFDYRMAEAFLDAVLQNTPPPIEIVSGRCSTGKITFFTPEGIAVCGADGLGELYAKNKGYPVKPFPADWKQYGSKAGPFRNKLMAEYGTAAVVFDGGGAGSQSMIGYAKAFKLPLRICKL